MGKVINVSPAPSHEPRNAYTYIKYGSLLVLVIQTTTCVLLLRYSKHIQPGVGYLSSTTILLSEIIKLFTCVFILSKSEGSFERARDLINREVILKPSETLKLSVPAFLYTIQNNLLFLALTNLDAATFQVTYQLKILTTALFSTLMLGRQLSRKQWISLLLLMIGVTLVQWPTDLNSKSSDSSTNASISNQSWSRLIGFVAVLLSCFSSGFSGVYFEKLVKFSQQSLWIRNLQLCLFGCGFSLLAILFQDGHALLENGFFQGYTSVTWCIVFVQAFGGLLVSFVMKYADNILKGFATSVSIIISTIFSYFVLADFVPSHLFAIGSFTVITATILYST